MIRHKIYGLFATSVMLTAMSACSDDAHIVKDKNTDDSGVITFTINSEAGQWGTRTDNGYESQYTDCFSDGSSIDMLLFAVYSHDKDSSDDYVLDDSFYKASQVEGIDRETEKQNVVKIDQFPVSVNLIPDQNKEYKIVFWAQNSGCTAYDTKDLSKVTISYEGAKANDPARDAFYCVTGFKGTEGGTKQITLVRPFAQINVGTSGWDYEGKAILQPNPEVMKYSSLKVTGVASEFNAFTSTVNSSNLQTVTFDYDVIPAYVEADAKNLLDEIDSDYIEAQSKNHFDSENNSFTSLFDEVYLKVNVDKDEKEKYNDYIGWYEYKYKTDKFFADPKNQGTTNYDEKLLKELLTEQFKYLATCYVLVPCILNEETNELQGSTCDVTFECTSVLPTGTPQPSVEADNVFSFTLNSVPVNRNWRTNIVSKAGSALFMNASQFKVDVYPEEYGDYYKRAQATDSNWSDGVGSGENENGDYNWPLDDIDSPLVLTGIQLYDDNNWIDWGDLSGRYVDLIKYMDGDKQIQLTISPQEMLRHQRIKEYVDVGRLSYECYLGDNKKSEGTFSSSSSDIVTTLAASEIFAIYKNFKAVTTTLTETETLYDEENYNAGDKPVTKDVEGFYLRYYPVEFRVKIILKDPVPEKDDDFKPNDLVIQLRVYTSYKFTFSSDSQDEGRDIWNNFQKTTTIGNSGDASDELGLHYVTNGDEISSIHLIVKSRDNGSITNNNNKVFAFSDHLRFRGAGNSTTGHFITLSGLQENCKITAKLGRDAGMDNHDKGTTSAHIRNLHVYWGQSPDYIEKDGWDGIAPFKDNETVNDTNIGTKIVFQDNDKTQKTTYVNSESKIMNGFDTTISKTVLTDGKDIKIYVDNVGHCYYWILLSEPNPIDNN